MGFIFGRLIEGYSWLRNKISIGEENISIPDDDYSAVIYIDDNNLLTAKLKDDSEIKLIQGEIE